jgi:hypothetical protein
LRADRLGASAASPPDVSTEATIRTKRPADAPACVAGLREAHIVDRYPLTWPEDPAGWLQPAGTIAAWVATLDSGAAREQHASAGVASAPTASPPRAEGPPEPYVGGHVVLRGAAGHRDVPNFAAATGLAEADHGLVSRLWVRPTWQGHGVARCSRPSAMRPVGGGCAPYWM